MNRRLVTLLLTASAWSVTHAASTTSYADIIKDPVTYCMTQSNAIAPPPGNKKQNWQLQCVRVVNEFSLDCKEASESKLPTSPIPLVRHCRFELEMRIKQIKI